MLMNLEATIMRKRHSLPKMLERLPQKGLNIIYYNELFYFHINI